MQGLSDEMRATFGRTDEQREAALGPGRPQKFPDECAARVVRAIREGQFFIFTHPDTRAAVEHRYAQLLAGFDDVDALTEQALRVLRAPEEFKHLGQAARQTVIERYEKRKCIHQLVQLFQSFQSKSVDTLFEALGKRGGPNE